MKKYAVYKDKVKLYGGVHYLGGPNRYYHEREMLKAFRWKWSARRFLKKVKTQKHFFLETFDITINK